MRLLDIEITAFKSARDTIKIQLANRGLVLIIGDNGAGKTLLPDAITWCLFGQTTRGDAKDGGASGDDVVNEERGKNCCVRLRFEDDAEEVWTCTRYRRHKQERNRVTLVSEKGIDRTQHLADDTDLEISKLVRHTFRSFMTSVVFGQGMLAPFSAMKPAQQSEIVDTITGAYVLQPATEVARARMNDKKREVAELESSIERERERFKELRGDLKHARSEDARQQRAHKQKIAQLQYDVERAEKRLARATKDEAAAQVWKDKVTTLETKLKKLNLAYMDAKTESATILSKLNDTIEHIKHYEQKKPGEPCLECGGKVDATNIKHALDSLRLVHSEQTKALAASRKAVVAAKQQLDNTETKRTFANRKAFTPYSVELAEDELQRCQRRLVEADVDAPATTQLDRLRERLRETRKKLSTMREALGRLVRTLDYLKRAEHEFNVAIRLDVQERTLPFLNAKARVASEFLTDGSVDVRFDTVKTNKSGGTRDMFSVTANNEHGSKLYKLQSRGERQKVDIIVARAFMALSREQSQSSVNVTVFDEPFDGLTDAATARVVDFLQEELRNTETVFVITHKTSLASYFTEIIEVAKTNNTTTYTDA